MPALINLLWKKTKINMIKGLKADCIILVKIIFFLPCKNPTKYRKIICVDIIEYPIIKLIENKYCKIKINGIPGRNNNKSNVKSIFSGWEPSKLTKAFDIPNLCRAIPTAEKIAKTTDQ